MSTCELTASISEGFTIHSITANRTVRITGYGTVSVVQGDLRRSHVVHHIRKTGAAETPPAEALNTTLFLRQHRLSPTPPIMPFRFFDSDTSQLTLAASILGLVRLCTRQHAAEHDDYVGNPPLVPL